ncbi:MAG: hypothetical protein A2086_01550 [Spirochaetes bacterium GWD1_27_9]|nr:MAG: hypothetical protein A2Z98_08905 [Spirochaetes bacterium GWB1_27_13]OHD28064.1 MAG: hypothetical protein A2Y34_02660 [Spirochaetes bacterium GWC1_27_15]OHD41760.1 MAG: hypothetical protein A2086_01550 [Spirochaetes bacterium GWD1_27_9]
MEEERSLADIESQFIQKQHYLKVVGELLLLCEEPPKDIQSIGSLIYGLSSQTEDLFLQCLDFAIKNRTV